MSSHPYTRLWDPPLHHCHGSITIFFWVQGWKSLHSPMWIRAKLLYHFNTRLAPWNREMEVFPILIDWSCQGMVLHDRRKRRGWFEYSERQVLSPLIPRKEDCCPSCRSSNLLATGGRIGRSSMGSLYRADLFRTRLEDTRGYEITALFLWP